MNIRIEVSNLREWKVYLKSCLRSSCDRWPITSLFKFRSVWILIGGLKSKKLRKKIEIGMFNLADRPCDLINRTNSPLIVFYPKYFQLSAVKKSRL